MDSADLYFRPLTAPHFLCYTEYVERLLGAVFFYARLRPFGSPPPSPAQNPSRAISPRLPHRLSAGGCQRSRLRGRSPQPPAPFTPPLRHGGAVPPPPEGEARPWRTPLALPAGAVIRRPPLHPKTFLRPAPSPAAAHPAGHAHRGAPCTPRRHAFSHRCPPNLSPLGSVPPHARQAACRPSSRTKRNCPVRFHGRGNFAYAISGGSLE